MGRTDLEYAYVWIFTGIVYWYGDAFYPVLDDVIQVRYDLPLIAKVAKNEL